MKQKAHAKINLHLQVGPRRRDGYHFLATIFQEISLHDTLTFQIAPRDLTLTVQNSKISAGPDNLVLRALEMLRRELGVEKGMKVALEKNIPMGAGLGGGSSDAAAALLAGWTLWTGKKISKRAPPLLFKCASRLGADVSFFLIGGTAGATGIGEKLKALPKQKKRWMVLVYPRVHVSTPKAYKWIDENRHTGAEVSLRAQRSNLKFAQDVRLLRSQKALPRNDFESVVLPRFPAIRRVKNALRELGCTGVMMSGSGSSVFGIVSGKTEAFRVKRRLSAKPWDVFAVHTI